MISMKYSNELSVVKTAVKSSYEPAKALAVALSVLLQAVFALLQAVVSDVKAYYKSDKRVQDTEAVVTTVKEIKAKANKAYSSVQKFASNLGVSVIMAYNKAYEKVTTLTSQTKESSTDTDTDKSI
jgi:hypothetical protein